MSTNCLTGYSKTSIGLLLNKRKNHVTATMLILKIELRFYYLLFSYCLKKGGYRAWDKVVDIVMN